MENKRIIFGAGYLGKRIGDALRYRVVSRAEVDANDAAKLSEFLDEEQPQVVINAVGKTGGLGAIGIDWCEKEENKSAVIRSNISAALNLSIECANRRIYFVHLGSGCIYIGDNYGNGFSETDAPNFYGPQFYAKTKIDAERILSNLPGLLLRIRMPIDDRPAKRNLIDKLKSYSRIIDIQNSMTTIPHMIPAIQKLIARDARGIYNLTNPGTMSAKEIMDYYKDLVEPAHEFGVFSVEELDSMTLARRSNCQLNTDKLQSKGIYLPEIHEAVKECLLRYRQALQ